jgi:hypothetical protein
MEERGVGSRFRGRREEAGGRREEEERRREEGEGGGWRREEGGGEEEGGVESRWDRGKIKASLADTFNLYSLWREVEGGVGGT